MDRREFLKRSAEMAAVAAVLQSTAFASRSKSASWTKELHEISLGILAGKVTPREWSEFVKKIYAEVSLHDVIEFTDVVNALKKASHPPEKLGAIKNVPWPFQGNYGHKLFLYRKGACSPPHAHNHLVSAHIVVAGSIRVRTFDRVEDLDGKILLRPKRDEIVGPGSVITMTDELENVHWFEGISKESASFDIPVPGVTPERTYRHLAQAYNQIFLDPTVKPRGDGLIEAPILSFTDSVKIFA